MITGFNTDVQYDGCVYHVQTEDRGRDHPVLESLVYIGGTIIAKKQTSYGEQLQQGATEEVIASLLRRQHQVIIKAIRSGRIDDLARHTDPEQDPIAREIAQPPATRTPSKTAEREVLRPSEQKREPPTRTSDLLAKTPPLVPDTAEVPATAEAAPSTVAPVASPSTGESQAAAGRVGLNLDQVISDYLKRSAEQGRLDLTVLTPNVFLAGKAINLKIQVSRGDAIESEAIVTVKIIGTAFKPQVHIARADRSGVATFSLTLPSFTAGTAAIVIEAQSNRGRGELKHLIRRA